jgi:hypothetical protein
MSATALRRPTNPAVKRCSKGSRMQHASARLLASTTQSASHSGAPVRDVIGALRLTTTPDRGSIIGVIKAVLLSSRARKDLKKAPAQVRDKLAVWILAVSEIGLAEVRKVPG